MEHVEVELYEHVPNFAVLRLPLRRFPGVLIQGDSLRILWDQARYVLAALEAGEPDTEQLDEARGAARDPAEGLEGRLRAYIDVLDRAGVGLPFRRPTFQEQPTEQPNA
jgi:hypothetical protein